MIWRSALLLIAAIVCLISSGCATPSEDKVSTIPWNRPQAGEGGTGFGGIRPPGSGGY